MKKMNKLSDLLIKSIWPGLISIYLRFVLLSTAGKFNKYTFYEDLIKYMIITFMFMFTVGLCMKIVVIFKEKDSKE
jgi:hypothetical protein